MLNFTEISQAPQPLFQGAWLMQTKKFVELYIDISEEQIFIVVINVLSEDSSHCSTETIPVLSS